jgi:DNA gyrase/topoisomerase IV subunit A
MRFIWSPPNTCCLRINNKEEYNNIRNNIKDLQDFLEKLNKKIEHIKGLLVKRRVRYYKKIHEASSETEVQKLQSNTTHDKYTNYEEQVVLATNKHLRVIEEMIEISLK